GLSINLILSAAKDLGSFASRRTGTVFSTNAKRFRCGATVTSPFFQWRTGASPVRSFPFIWTGEGACPPLEVAHGVLCSNQPTSAAARAAARVLIVKFDALWKREVTRNVAT